MIAQSVEHAAVNRSVVGSSPTQGAMAQWLSWLERRPVTAEVVGSSPIRVAQMFERLKSLTKSSEYSIICVYCLWDLSSAGRASALQAEGHRFEPYRSHFNNMAE